MARDTANLDHLVDYLAEAPVNIKIMGFVALLNISMDHGNISFQLIASHFY